MKSCTAHKKAFTLVELLVTLLVLCIIIVLALPALRTLLLNNRLTSNANLLVNALNYARGTALNQSMTVMVCPFNAANSTSCGANWSSGWIVVSLPSSGTNTLLQSQQTTSNDPVLSANVSSILFDSHGLTTTQGNFTLCDTRGASFAQSVEVMSTGFVQSSVTPGQAVWNNGALACP